MKTVKELSLFVILAAIIIGTYWVNKVNPESLTTALAEKESVSETNTVPVEARIAVTEKSGSLIQTTGMTETQAKEFGEDNDIPTDNHGQPISHEGSVYMLFPDLLNPGDSIWFADNYANKKIY